MTRAESRLPRPIRPLVVVLATALAACGGGGVSGTYANPEGNASVEFMKDGKAHFSLTGVGGDCTWRQQQRTVVVTCEGEPITFTVGDDGALTGPPGTYMARMKPAPQGS